MNRRTHLRNGAVAALSVLLIFLLAYQQLPASAAPFEQGSLIVVEPSTREVSLAPGSGGTAAYTITNNTAETRTISTSLPSFPSGITVAQQSAITVGPTGSQGTLTLNVSVTTAVAPGRYGPFTINFNAVGGGSTQPASAFLVIIVTGATFTPTPTITATVGAPTVTPTRGPVCRDGFEADNNPASAKVIDVNTSQERAICPSGDEDWLVFGGVAGKVYTIDVSRMDPGIDLSLELFDPELRSIAFNDDFFNRDPGSPNPGDIRPRITIRIPFDGRYYVKIRDNAGRGGVNYLYVVALLSESFGPTPTLVREICQDLFEPDGLPEEARLITSNEIQEDRRLCPAGDADWVTFFGKAGKRYIIYTDSRRYRGRNVVNGETQAGADTVMVLADRDGVSLIDINDDIPGGSSLDSQIEFTPEVDGFYFVQVKNTGDIGNQFIRYDLVLLLCVPGQSDCGRASVPGTPVAPLTPLPTGTPDNEFNLDPSPTVGPTPRA